MELLLKVLILWFLAAFASLAAWINLGRRRRLPCDSLPIVRIPTGGRRFVWISGRPLYETSVQDSGHLIAPVPSDPGVLL